MIRPIGIALPLPLSPPSSRHVPWGHQVALEIQAQAVVHLAHLNEAAARILDKLKPQPDGSSHGWVARVKRRPWIGLK